MKSYYTHNVNVDMKSYYTHNVNVDMKSYYTHYLVGSEVTFLRVYRKSIVNPKDMFSSILQWIRAQIAVYIVNVISLCFP